MEFFNLYSFFLWLALTGIALGYHVPAPYPPDVKTLHLKYGGTWVTPGMIASLDGEPPSLCHERVSCALLTRYP